MLRVGVAVLRISMIWVKYMGTVSRSLPVPFGHGFVVGKNERGYVI